MRPSDPDRDARVRRSILLLAAMSAAFQVVGIALRVYWLLGGFSSANMDTYFAVFAAANTVASVGAVLVLLGFLVLGWEMFARGRLGQALIRSSQTSGWRLVLVGAIVGVLGVIFLDAAGFSPRGGWGIFFVSLAGQIIEVFALPFILVGLSWQVLPKAAVPPAIPPPPVTPVESRNP